MKELMVAIQYILSKVATEGNNGGNIGYHNVANLGNNDGNIGYNNAVNVGNNGGIVHVVRNMCN